MFMIIIMHFTQPSARPPSTVSRWYKILLHDSSLGQRGTSTSPPCLPPHAGSLLDLEFIEKFYCSTYIYMPSRPLKSADGALLVPPRSEFVTKVAFARAPTFWISLPKSQASFKCLFKTFLFVEAFGNV